MARGSAELAAPSLAAGGKHAAAAPAASPPPTRHATASLRATRTSLYTEADAAACCCDGDGSGAGPTAPGAATAPGAVAAPSAAPASALPKQRALENSPSHRALLKEFKPAMLSIVLGGPQHHGYPHSPSGGGAPSPRAAAAASPGAASGISPGAPGGLIPASAPSTPSAGPASPSSRLGRSGASPPAQAGARANARRSLDAPRTPAGGTPLMLSVRAAGPGSGGGSNRSAARVPRSSARGPS